MVSPRCCSALMKMILGCLFVGILSSFLSLFVGCITYEDAAGVKMLARRTGYADRGVRAVVAS
jgi:hypothetical protein